MKENEQLFKKYNIDKWQRDNLGEGINVVFIDMGNAVFDYIPATFPIASRKNYKDDHIAGVAAVFYRIAPRSNMIIFTPAETVEYDATFNWIKEHKNEIDLINISMSMSKSVAERMHIPEINNLGIPIICSAGNQEDDRDKMKYPALYDYSIAVGAYNDEYNWVEGTVEGEGMTCVAPYKTHYVNSKGVAISQYGTSYAAPFVSGCLALYLIWRKRNNLKKLSKEELKEFVIDNCESILGKGHSIKSGYGLFKLPGEIPMINNKPTPEIPKGDDNLDLKDYFKDDDGKWHEQFNNELAALGILDGDGKGNFRPNDTVTRAELSKVASVLRRNILDEVKKMIGGK